MSKTNVPASSKFTYKNAKTEITSEHETTNHGCMMWFDLVMKWVYKFSGLWVIYHTPEVLEKIKMVLRIF